MKITKDNFVWCTRGYYWGFRFISKARFSDSDTIELWKSIFENDESAAGMWNGYIYSNGKLKYSYIACRLQKNDFYDESSRPIRQEILIVSDPAERFQNIDSDWEENLYKKLLPVLQKIHKMTVSEIKHFLEFWEMDAEIEFKYGFTKTTIHHLDIHLSGPQQTRAPLNTLIVLLFIFSSLFLFLSICFKSEFQKLWLLLFDILISHPNA